MRNLFPHRRIIKVRPSEPYTVLEEGNENNKLSLTPWNSVKARTEDEQKLFHPASIPLFLVMIESSGMADFAQRKREFRVSLGVGSIGRLLRSKSLSL